MKILKNLRKRGLALFLVLTMCLSMLPATALAAEGETGLLRPNPDGVTSTDGVVTINKWAERTGPDEWKVTMTVAANGTSISSEPMELVILLDTSGSMTWCTEEHQHTANCGERNLTCQLEEHTHQSDCYKLSCGKQESYNYGGHRHDWKCYKLACEKDAHRHTASCYTYPCGKIAHSHNANTQPCDAAALDYRLSRQYIAGTKAQELVKKLCDMGLNATVSVVTFANNGTETNAKRLQLTNENLPTINSSIQTYVDADGNEIFGQSKATGSTHMADGLRVANSLFTDSAGQKVIVMLADGDKNGTDPTGPDGIAAVIRGNDTKEMWIDNSRYTVKGNGATIYTIGFATTEAAGTLTDVAGSADRYYQASNALELSNAFTQIATKLTAMVQDNMGAHVNVQPESVDEAGKKPVVSNGILSWNADGGTIQAGETKTITYTVKLDTALDAENQSKVPVGENTSVSLNGNAVLTYRTGDSETSNTLKFPLPTDTINYGTLDQVYQAADGTTLALTDAEKATQHQGLVKWNGEGESFTVSKPAPTRTVEKDGKTVTYYYTGSTFEGKTVTWGEGDKLVVPNEFKALQVIHNYSTFPITVIKTADPLPEGKESYKAGDDVTWTITVTNNSQTPVSGLKVTDTLKDADGNAPTNLTVDVKAKTGSTDPNNFELAAGASVEFTATLKDAPAGSYKNAVVVESGPEKTEEVTTPDPVPVKPNVTVEKRVEDRPDDGYKVGDTVKWTITVTNNGDELVEGLSLTDTPTVPEGVITDTNKLTWSGPEGIDHEDFALEGKEGNTNSVTFTVSLTATKVGTYTNLVVVEDSEGNELDKDDTGTPVPNPDNPENPTPNPEIIKVGIPATGMKLPYKVEHYFQNVGNNGYTIDEELTVNDVAVKGTEIKAEDKKESVDGFIFNTTLSDVMITSGLPTPITDEEGKVTGAQVPTLKLYYDRVTGGVNYVYQAAEGSPELPDAIKTTDGTGDYAVSDSNKYRVDATVTRKDPTSSKYVVPNGEWNLTWDKASATMPAAGSVTFTGTWTYTQHTVPMDLQVRYFVRYFYENENGAYVQLEDIKPNVIKTVALSNKEATVEVEVDEQDIAAGTTVEGMGIYTYNANHQSTQTTGTAKWITSADDIVYLDLYYRRATGRVTYVYQAADGSTLPDAISTESGSYAVSDSDEYRVGAAISCKGRPVNTTTYAVTNDDGSTGVWTLTSWTQTSLVMVAGGVTFTGTWTYTQTSVPVTPVQPTTVGYFIRYFYENETGAFVTDESDNVFKMATLSGEALTADVAATLEDVVHGDRDGYVYYPAHPSAKPSATVLVPASEADIVYLDLYYALVPQAAKGDIHVTKTPDRTEVRPGEPVTWTITVENRSTDGYVYTGLYLRDELRNGGTPSTLTGLSGGYTVLTRDDGIMLPIENPLAPELPGFPEVPEQDEESSLPKSPEQQAELPALLEMADEMQMATLFEVSMAAPYLMGADPSNFDLYPGEVAEFTVSYLVQSGDMALLNMAYVDQPQVPGQPDPTPDPIGSTDSDEVPVVTVRYTVTASIDNGGTITGSGSFAGGGSTTVTWAPATDYRVTSVTVDGAAWTGTGSSVTFSSIDADHTVVVTTEPIPVTQPTYYYITYAWRGPVPDGQTLPVDTRAYTLGQSYTVDSTLAAGTTVTVRDAYGNITGTYTFNGWETSNGIITGNLTIYGSWTYAAAVTPPSGGNPVNPVTPVTPVTPNPPATSIPDGPTPLAPTPATTIEDEDVPLAAPGLNSTDHFDYIKGYGDGTVKPEANITRAEVATIFFRLMTDEFRTENWATENAFTDVKAGDWFNNAISTAAKAGILNGYENGSFQPNKAITRAEFAAIAARFASDVVPSGGMFSDIEGHWAQESIERASAAGWIRGSEGLFRPEDKITRAEAITLINRMLDRVPDVDHMLPDMITFSDNTEDKWYYADVQEATNSHDYDRDEIGVTEIWTELLPAQDWTALEKVWATAASAPSVDVASKDEDDAQPETEGETEPEATGDGE